MFEKILEYQKLDAQILNLKRELSNNPASLTLNKVVVLVKDAQNKLIELEDKAKSSIDEYENCKKEFSKVFLELEKLNKQDLSKLSGDKLNESIEKLNQTSSTLNTLERSLSYQAENINNILKIFEVYKNNIVASRQKYSACKEECLALENKIKPQIEDLKKQMTALEKSIDEQMLNKYKHLRQDHIFPILVPFLKNACGGCSMEVPSALRNRLNEKGYLECEQCRRIIYLA